LRYDLVGESFETSVPWDKCSSLCENVKAVVAAECRKRGIVTFHVSCRVTQTYDAGACVYFYFGYRDLTIADQMGTYEAIESAARDEVLASGEFCESFRERNLNVLLRTRRIHFTSSRRWQDSCQLVQAKHLATWS